MDYWPATFDISLAGYNQLSIYQNPSIYQGYELFLLGPVGIGIFASWAVLKFDKFGMLIVFVCFLLSFILVVFIYEHYPTESKIHTYNWVLSYCLPALALAMLGRLIIDLTYYVHPSRAAKRCQYDFGDTTNTSFLITHNLNTLDVVVCIRSNSGDREDFAPARIERPSTNQVRVVCTAPPGLNALHAIIDA